MIHDTTATTTVAMAVIMATTERNQDLDSVMAVSTGELRNTSTMSRQLHHPIPSNNPPTHHLIHQGHPPFFFVPSFLRLGTIGSHLSHPPWSTPGFTPSSPEPRLPRARARPPSLVPHELLGAPMHLSFPWLPTPAHCPCSVALASLAPVPGPGPGLLLLLHLFLSSPPSKPAGKGTAGSEHGCTDWMHPGQATPSICHLLPAPATRDMGRTPPRLPACPPTRLHGTRLLDSVPFPSLSPSILSRS
ncbi:hypothetical protein EV126DRAFT_73339 [Verticillium dahliae]|nr:hypothetical protein EV126DRAFT_73339 [Verticillium dahliae]